MIMPNIKPDAPGTKPGESGNGRVLVLNERQQKFNGHVYSRQADGNYTYKINKQKFWLHIDVWTYHNDESISEGSIIHHDHRCPDGVFDKNENNIDWLRLMTRSEHMAYHRANRPLVERVCQRCGKRFWTTDPSAKYCSDECRERHAQSNRQILCTCVVCGKTFPARRNNPALTCSDECAQVVADVEMPVLHTPEETFEAKTIRVCPICGRLFIAQTTNPAITCSNACSLIPVRIDISRKKALQERLSRTDGTLNFANKALGIKIRTLIDSGEPWFIARDICLALDIEDERGALARLDADEKISADDIGFSEPLTVVNMFGLRQLIGESRAPYKNEFKHWIVEKVTPSLRKQCLIMLYEPVRNN